MTAMPFKEEFAPAVEDGSKGQTIRGANCLNKECQKLSLNEHGQCDKIFWHGHLCKDYKHRIKPGDTLQLYTGMMQRKYCKFSGKLLKFPCFDATSGNIKLSKNPQTLECECASVFRCPHQGAKLLKTATCTESFPIKFEDLTEEIARMDGFETTKGFGMEFRSPLYNLKDFLIKEYDANDEDVFQVIRWRLT